MKAKELMIGDFILGNTWSNKAERISSIDTDSIVANIDSVYFEGQFKPIPLTEDILKANGFKLYNCSWQVYIAGVIRYNFENTRLVIVDRINMIGIKYVHELQHALRLCGLTELVDNFKIK